MFCVSDIQYYFEYIIKISNTDPPISLYIIKIKIIITFKNKTRMKLLGDAKNKTAKNKSGENTELIFIDCNIVIYDYLQYSRFLRTFVSNK